MESSDCYCLKVTRRFMVEPVSLCRAGKEGSLQQQLERSSRKAEKSKSLHLVPVPDGYRVCMHAQCVSLQILVHTDQTIAEVCNTVISLSMPYVPDCSQMEVSFLIWVLLNSPPMIPLNKLPLFPYIQYHSELQNLMSLPWAVGCSDWCPVISPTQCPVCILGFHLMQPT